MDLREKLRQLDPGLTRIRQPARRQTGKAIEQLINGEVVSNAYGEFFRTITVFPNDHQHGCVSFDLLSEVRSDILELVGKDESLRNVDLRQAIFLDTETTGLAGGSGTVPFLVGLGYFYDDGFRVEQFFMRDYNEEKAVLHQIFERMKNYEVLVSYNGKAYDVNILTSRLTLGRMDPSFLNLPHLDLLFSVRRVWSQRIGACNLSHVEREILGFIRQDDIPSFMIPGLYFEYLKTGNGGCVEPIFTHNKWDIVALVVLTALLGRIYQSPADLLDHPFDLISIGKSFDRLYRHGEAVGCYRKALHYPLETHERERVLRSLGFSLKRAGDYENAAEVWEEMVGKHPDQIVPYEELAKYYEHQLGDFNRAIEIVNRALAAIDLFSQLHPDIQYGNDKRDLEYRLARLKRKKENHSGKN